MNFLHPGLLFAGLAAVSLPIIIHLLFRQRRRPVMWGAMRFLLEAYRKRRRRLKLEHLILLLVRCLILACLAFALGRPLLDAAGLLGSSGHDVYLVVDNSVASSLRDAAGTTALERHKRKARALLNELNAGDRVGLISLGSPADAVVLPASADAGAVGRLIESLTATDGAADIQGAVSALAAHLEALDGDEDPRPTMVVLVSDLRQGSADVTRPLSDALAGLDNVRLVTPEPTALLAGNTQIVGIDPLRAVVLTGAGRAAEDVSVRVRLARSGSAVGEASVTTVRLRALEPDELDAPGEGERATVRWTPGQSEASVTMTARLDRASEEGAGASVLVATIDRDALEADNTHRTPVRITDALEVGIVGSRRFSAGTSVADRSAADWLRPALAPTDTTPVRITDLEPGALDAASLARLDAVFVARPDLVPEESWPDLRAFADEGRLVVVMPPSETTVHLWTDPFIGAFGLDWTFPREAIDAPGDSVWSLSPTDAPEEVLALLADELEPLVRPVGVFRHLAPDLGTDASSRSPITLNDGTPWLVVARSDGGNTPSGGSGNTVDNSTGTQGLLFYLSSAPTLTWTDLPARPLMVPLAQELVRQGVGATSRGNETIAGRTFATPSAATSLERLSSGSETTRLDVDSASGNAGTLRRAGVWRARDDAGRERAIVGVNADAGGADTTLNDPDAVRAWLAGAFGSSADAGERVAWMDDQDPGAALARSDRASPFSFPLLVAALVLALIETGLARWFAHAWRRPTDVRGAIA